MGNDDDHQMWVMMRIGSGEHWWVGMMMMSGVGNDDDHQIWAIMRIGSGEHWWVWD